MPRSREEILKSARRLRTDYLLEQAGVTLARAQREADALGKFGVTEELLARGADLTRRIQGALKERALAQAVAQAATAAQNAAAVPARDWLRQAILVGTNAYDGEARIVDEFGKGGKIGGSVPKLVSRIRRVLGLLRKDAALCAKFGATADFVKKGGALVKALQAADLEQERRLEELPQGTQGFYADKGHLYSLLKTVNRAARAAHVREPTAAATWDLSILHRRAGGGGGRTSGPGTGTGEG